MGGLPCDLHVAGSREPRAGLVQRKYEICGLAPFKVGCDLLVGETSEVARTFLSAGSGSIKVSRLFSLVVKGAVFF